MAIQYEFAQDIKVLVEEIVKTLNFHHILSERVICIRSKGSKSSDTIARIHGLPKIWQKVLSTNPYYIIEVISERYDSLSVEEKEKTIIHELLHIPEGFQGGFRHHAGWINQKKIAHLYNVLIERRAKPHSFSASNRV